MSHLASLVPAVPSVKYASNISISLVVIVAMTIVIVVIMEAIAKMTLELRKRKVLWLCAIP